MLFDKSEFNNLVSKVGDTIVDTSKNLKDATMTTIDTAPMSMKLREKESYLEKQYFELGVLYYEKHVHDEEPEYEQIKRITEVLEEIKELKGEIAEKKGKEVCPSCGEYVDKGVRFCPHCGKNLDE